MPTQSNPNVQSIYCIIFGMKAYITRQRVVIDVKACGLLLTVTSTNFLINQLPYSNHT